MGLAASQARLLFITSRQNDVSAKMQRLSNENIILARDEEDISEKYSQMLNATKLVYNTEEDGGKLVYDSLMGVGAYDNGKCNIVVNSANQVVLSNTYKDCLTKLTALSGTGAQFQELYSLSAFKEALSPTLETELLNNDGAGQLTDEMATKLQSFKESYGSYPLAKAMSGSAILSKLVDSNGNPVPMSKELNAACGAQKAHSSYGFHFDNNISNKSFWEIANPPGGSDYITVLADDGDNSGVPDAQARSNFMNIGWAIVRRLATAFGVSGEVSEISQSTKTSFGTAMKAYIQDLSETITFSDENRTGNTDDGCQKGVNDAKKALVGNVTITGGRDDRDGYTLNLSEYTRRLTAKAISLYSSCPSPSANVKDPSNACSMNTQYAIAVNEKGYDQATYESRLRGWFADDAEYATVLKTLKNQATKEANKSSNTKDAYFNTLYKALCERGWSFEDISSISEHLNDPSSGYSVVYQQTASKNEYLEEVPDEEVRNQAEIFYNREMKKIHRKEKQIDTDMTKLQTEYTSLTNDYNSVKGIIDANIQRSFTYCQSG